MNKRLRTLDLKKSYDSDYDDVLNDFYVPALGVAVAYDRLAGFFSSTSLAVAARGITGLVSNGGRIRLVCGAKLRKEDIEAISEAREEVIGAVTKSALRELDDLERLESIFVTNHVKGLGWMMARDLLDIRIAVVRDMHGKPLHYEDAIRWGIFHQKVGILHDSEGNSLSFSGSDNETATAWLHNIEEFKVFCSWDETQGDYLEADINRFNRFWMGQGKRTEVLDIPEAVKKKLVEIAPDDIEQLELSKLTPGERKKPIEFWSHQNQAIDQWLRNNKRCIFEMATGSGKTVAALGCLRHLLLQGEKLVAVITCPYSHLMGQWKEALERLDLDIDMIDAFGGNPRWRDEMTDGIRDVANDIRRALVILTTHDTFYKDDFKEFLTLAKCKLFLIADEVHGTGSELRVSGLTDQYDFRLGLSATPSRWFDPEGTGFLLDYFGVKEEESIFVFSLEDAIRTINPETGETYLTPYEYKPQFIELTDDEMDEYIAKTRKIARSFYSSKNRAEKDEYFSLLCAYSDALWPLIPNQSGHLFRSIVASHSDPIWPPLKG